VNGTSLVLTYDEALDAASIPLGAAFTIGLNGGAGPAVNNVVLTANEVTLTLAAGVVNGDGELRSRQCGRHSHSRSGNAHAQTGGRPEGSSGDELHVVSGTCSLLHQLA
jgi:hypothetical protein